jgi:hypothetical protein
MVEPPRDSPPTMRSGCGKPKAFNTTPNNVRPATGESERNALAGFRIF